MLRKVRLPAPLPTVAIGEGDASDAVVLECALISARSAAAAIAPGSCRRDLRRSIVGSLGSPRARLAKNLAVDEDELLLVDGRLGDAIGVVVGPTAELHHTVGVVVEEDVRKPRRSVGVARR